MYFKKYAQLVLIISALAFSGCSAISSEPQSQTIGVFMPCEASERWSIDAEEITNILEDEGFEVKVFFADKDAEKQKQQIDEMIDYGVSAMIICPYNNENLATSLDIAKTKGIRIIAYEKLIINTYAVDYFACFDNFLIGVLQGTSLVEGMHTQGKSPYNIEIFIGHSNDTTAKLYYEGAMSVLQPLINTGELVVASNEITIGDISVEDRSSYANILRLDSLISKYYSGKTELDGILAPNDKLSYGFIEVVENSIANETYPIITGQNAELDNVRAILDSKQYSTVYKDAEALAQVACSMTIAALNGETPELNDTETFDNGVKVVPAFLCEPILIIKENIESVLIDSGYYSYDEIFTEK